MEEKITTLNIYDIAIRMAFLALIIGWCLLIMLPFGSIVLWSIILALAIAPLHRSFSKMIGNRPKIASIIIVLIGFIILMLPGWLFLDSLIDSIKTLKASFQAGTLTIPPPSESVKSWPVIGIPLYNLWQDASVNLEQTIIQNKEQIVAVGSKVLGGILGIGGGILQLIVSLIIAGVLVVSPGAGEAIRKFFRKIAGLRGDEFADIANKTVGNVVKGILGVAFVQSLLVGVGFLLAGVPYAGIWTLIVFVLAILQIPPTLVVIPVIIWLFSSMATVPAILWSIFLLIGAISDNVLKPFMLGKGAPVPMLVIFIGVIGGFMLQGFIGLFTGAIVISLGYKLLIAWIAEAKPVEIPKEPVSVPEVTVEG